MKELRFWLSYTCYRIAYWNPPPYFEIEETETCEHEWVSRLFYRPDPEIYGYIERTWLGNAWLFIWTWLDQKIVGKGI